MGGQASKASSELKNDISGSVKTFMETRAEGDVNVVCQNKQIVEGARGCDIQFADQVCEAIGISNMSSNMSLDTNVAQDMMNQISAAAEASNEGIAPLMLQVSHSSNIVKNTAEMVMDMAQSFSTTCTRDVSAINEQTVRDCDGSVVKFAPQMASGEVIGDCVANHIGNMQATQTLTNAVDMQTSASNKGIDLWMLFLVIAGFFLLLLLGLPIFVFGLGFAAKVAKGATAQDPGKDEPKTAAGHHTKGRLKVVFLLFVVFIAISAVWWPGYFASRLGIWPWRYPGKIESVNPITGEKETNPCSEGRSVDPDVFVNSWMWYDPYCTRQAAITKDGRGDGSGSTECDRFVRYERCGLFARDFGCDDPEFVADHERYKTVMEACGGLQGKTFKRCTPPDIAAEIIAGENTTYSGCVRCTGNSDEEKSSDDPRARVGFWRRAPKFVNNKDFLNNMQSSFLGSAFEAIIKNLEADSSSEEWGSCEATRISKYAYLRQEGDPQCPGDDPDCFTNEAEFQAASPGECMNSAYQRAKRKVSMYMKQCDKVQEVAKYNINTEGEVPLLRKQCPPNAFDYLRRCSASDKKCYYKPSACICDGEGECDCSAADSRTIASCKNDLRGCCITREDGELECLDNDYRADILAYEKANGECTALYNEWNSYHPWGWIVPLVFQIILLGVMVYLMLQHPPTQQQFMNGLYSQQTQTWWSYIIPGFLVVAVLASGWPFGILAVAYAGGPFTVYDKKFVDDLDSFNPTTAMIVGWVVFSVSSLALLAYGSRRLRNKLSGVGGLVPVTAVASSNRGSRGKQNAAATNKLVTPAPTNWL